MALRRLVVVVGGRNEVVLLRLLSALGRSCGASIGIFRLLPTFIPLDFASNQRRIRTDHPTMRILSKLFLAGLALAASPANACDSTVDIVLATSGASGFDDDGNNFNILRELVLLTGKCHHWFCLYLCASTAMQSSDDE